MKILQISDLHVTKDSKLEQYMPKIECMLKAIKSEVDENESIIVMVCGDLVDKGDPSGYPIVHEILSTMRNRLSSHRLLFKFTPGNHEINECATNKLEDFGKFLTDFGVSADIANTKVVKACHEGINFIILNSCANFNTKYGEVDLSALNSELEGVRGPVIWVGHHTMFSRYSDDASSIRNSHALIGHILKSPS